ncbi:MAG TPA: ABC transporter transmembrane domain-containing protein [Kofleriaceae bacterium]|nr:ABC transporter transmembrane domain-containing protein [Kofleriaceae bacterium]
MVAPYVDEIDPAAQPRDRRRLAVLWRLLPLLRPHRGRFVLALVTLCAASGVTLFYPWAAREAIDVGMRAGMGTSSTHSLDVIVGALIGVFVINAVLVWFRHYSVSWLGERVVADLRGLVFDRVLTLPMAWFHERRSGELVGRLASDVTVIEGVVGSELSMALRNTIQMIGAMVLLFVIDVKLTVYMLVIVPPVTLTTIYFGRRIRRMSRAVQDELAQVSGQVQESVGAIATVQAFVRETYEARRYRTGVERAFGKTLDLVRWRSWFFSTAMTTGYSGVAVVIWLGGRALIRHELTPGELTSFFLYTFYVAGALSDVAGLWGSLQRAAGATDRLFAVIDTVPAIGDPAEPIALPAGKGAVRFAGVSFAYPSRRAQPVLHEVSIDIAPGEVVALVGPSGAGKSTVLNLLYRFYDVDAGQILVEGVDVRRLRLAELRRALAMVAQEPVLFSGSIRDNIAYGRDGASDAEIEQAARDAYAHDFVAGFPDGYATVIGERGTKLSGGQKQRIALARALLADPRVLILDEATSNLDAESEAAVQAALARLMQGRTTIIVAHRLSTVRDADRIIVLDGARVVEHGRHDELMARRGVYHRLVEHQLIADQQAAS